MDNNFTHLIYNIQFPVTSVPSINGHTPGAINGHSVINVNTQSLSHSEPVLNFSIKPNNTIETSIPQQHHIQVHTQPVEALQQQQQQTTVTVAKAVTGGSDSSKRYVCEKCSLVFKHKEMHRRHMNVHAEKFKCPTCGKCFQSNYYLVRHHKRTGSCELILRQQRQNYNVQCPMCDFKTTSKVNLRSHLIKHTDKNQCKVCKHTFLRQRDLQTHNKSQVNCNKYLMM